MKKNTLTNTFAAMLAIASATGLHAQSDDVEFVPFNQFLKSTADINSTVMNRADSKVRERKNFEEMRRHVLSLYAGVEVSHSFVRDASTFDCVPVEQQPGLRMLGATSIAEQPPASMLSRPSGINGGGFGEGSFHGALATDGNARADRFGNSTVCEANTIPMRRITLDEMVRFSSLREYFQKGPDGAGQPMDPDTAKPASASDGHKYAYMLQHVNNIGGGSNLNLWNPVVDTNHGQVMSLSQEWYIGGSGTSTQTAEVGWQVMPRTWGTNYAVLFIYYTADGYTKTGCYNLGCGAFVQVSKDVTLGASFPYYSTKGGDQYDFSAQYMLYKGNWWLAIDGEWIGYFKGSIYGNGQLTKNAQTIEFGSESVGSPVWPQEGSGEWATAGFGYAAYQRNMFYTDLSGNGYYAKLTAANPSPACYNTAGPYTDSSDDWQVFFYLGGPGGSTCQ